MAKGKKSPAVSAPASAAAEIVAPVVAKSARSATCPHKLCVGILALTCSALAALVGLSRTAAADVHLRERRRRPNSRRPTRMKRCSASAPASCTRRATRRTTAGTFAPHSSSTSRRVLPPNGVNDETKATDTAQRVSARQAAREARLTVAGTSFCTRAALFACVTLAERLR